MIQEWASLEGQYFKIDVGTTTAAALAKTAAADAPVIHYTTDGDIVMNGVQFTDTAGLAALKADMKDKFKDLGEFTTSSEGEAKMAEWANVFGETVVFFTYKCSTPNARTAFAFQSISANVSTQYLFLAGEWYRRTVTANEDKSTTASAWSAGIMDAYTKAEVDAKIGDISTILTEING